MPTPAKRARAQPTVSMSPMIHDELEKGSFFADIEAMADEEAKTDRFKVDVTSGSIEVEGEAARAFSDLVSPFTESGRVVAAGQMTPDQLAEAQRLARAWMAAH